ncbi:MAG: PQQ-dependent sugar dehydrogenase [Candidatus Latescibacteria bacterium]|nr:PQQ-dependent sugar dehydrogenase [Candidatus Latescibacterota bacterium]
MAPNSSHWAIWLLINLVFTLPLSVTAQEESLPVVRIDRIPTSPAFAGQTRAPAARESAYKVESVVSELSFPWAFAFLPDGDIIIVERRIGLRIFGGDGTLSPPLSGIPAASEYPDYPSFGWFDVALDPDFQTNRLLYFSYYAADENDPEAAGTATVARARLREDKMGVENPEVVLRGFGTQEIHFSPNGSLLVSGAGDFNVDNPQDPANANGKLLRVRADGSVPDDNPFRSKTGAMPEVFTVGHRDISGIDTNPVTGDVWISEHGPRGGDELNIIRSGKNYGWKVISYGTDDSGKPIGNGEATAIGMEQAVYFWRPSIAPSSLSFYEGEMFPEWQGSVFVGALSGAHLTRLVISNNRVVGEERLLVDRDERIRAVKAGPDGALYVLTNEASGAPRGTAELLRLTKP